MLGIPSEAAQEPWCLPSFAIGEHFAPSFLELRNNQSRRKRTRSMTLGPKGLVRAGYTHLSRNVSLFDERYTT